jgi:hypothetical protein
MDSVKLGLAEVKTELGSFKTEHKADCEALRTNVGDLRVDVTELKTCFTHIEEGLQKLDGRMEKFLDYFLPTELKPKNH